MSLSHKSFFVLVALALTVQGAIPAEYTQLGTTDNTSADFGAGTYYIDGNHVSFTGYACDGNDVYGAGQIGQDRVLEAFFTIAASHYSAIIQYDLWAVDTWDTNDSAISYLGNAWELGTEINNVTQPTATTNYCGMADNDAVVAVESVAIAHTEDTLKLAIHNDLDEANTNESLGITNVAVWVAYCDLACSSCHGPTDQDCGLCATGYTETNGFCLLDGVVLHESVTTQAEFTASSGWTLGNDNSGSGWIGTTCDGVDVWGAYTSPNGSSNVTGTFSSLPAHYTAAAIFDIWMVDSWDYHGHNDLVTASLDTQDIVTVTRVFPNSHSNLCGSSTDDVSVTFSSGSVAHSDSSISLFFDVTLNESWDNESFGVANVYLYLGLCSEHCEACFDASTCTACGADYHAENGVCVLDCDTSDAVTRHEGVMWIHDLVPVADATRGDGQIDIVFSFEEPAECPGTVIDFEASFSEAGTEAGSDVYVDGTEWKVDLILEDTDLLNPTICTSSNVLASGTVLYSCTLWFSGFYLDDRIVNWSYNLNAQLQTDSTLDLTIITDTGVIDGDIIELPIESAFVTGFGDSTPQDSEFIVGDEIFIEVTAPTDLQGDLVGDITLVTIADNENTDVFDMTSLSFDQTNGNGRVIVRVPLIIVTTGATISVTCEWALDGVRRLDDAAAVTKYSVIIDISPLAEDNSNETEESDNSSSDDSNSMLIIIAVASAIVLIAAIGFGYKYISKNKKQTQEPVALPTTERALDSRV